MAIRAAKAMIQPALLVIAWSKDPDSQGTVRFVSGQTIIVPPEPEPERRNRWRIN